MLLRDEIAARVVSLLVANDEQSKNHFKGCENVIAEHCRLAYLVADAMMLRRNDESKSNCAYLLKKL